MGDPRKLKKKYEPPRKLWDSTRIAEESGLIEEYGLKSMRELWKSKAELGKIRREARKLLSKGEGGRAQAKQLLDKVVRLGLGTETTSIEDLLSLTIRDILERRLQTQVCKKGFAKSLPQSRQLITHGFISISGKKVSVPGYTVPVFQEKLIGYYKAIDINSGEGEGKAPKPS
ncbi:MAG: 30S ribosomal protein S4 [Candidatus Micrarchaeota archaeon]